MPDGPTVTVPARTHTLRAAVLLAFAAWNIWVWATRAWNMAQGADEFSTAFVSVHLVLFGSGIIGSIVLAWIGVRMIAEARRARGMSS